MSSLIDLLTECWMINDALLSNSDSVILIVHLVYEKLRMSYISTLIFNTKPIGLEVLDLVQQVIWSGSQPYESY